MKKTQFKRIILIEKQMRENYLLWCGCLFHSASALEMASYLLEKFQEFQEYNTESNLKHHKYSLMAALGKIAQRAPEKLLPFVSNKQTYAHAHKHRHRHAHRSKLKEDTKRFP